MLHGERLLVQPERGLLFGERLLAVDPSVPEPDVAQGVQNAREAGGEEGALELLGAVADARHPAEHLRRGPLAVGALAVRPYEHTKLLHDQSAP
jgi:hypothetical protein